MQVEQPHMNITLFCCCPLIKSKSLYFLLVFDRMMDFFFTSANVSADDNIVGSGDCWAVLLLVERYVDG